MNKIVHIFDSTLLKSKIMAKIDESIRIPAPPRPSVKPADIVNRGMKQKAVNIKSTAKINQKTVNKRTGKR